MNRDSDNNPIRRLRMAMVVFRETIRADQLRYFRGAVIEMSDSDPLFHNHRAEGFHYRYPLIQYKLIDGSPAILGIEEGAERIAEMFGERKPVELRIGNRLRAFGVASFAEWEAEVGLSESPREYFIQDWLPFNVENYRRFQEAGGLIARLEMLQRILTGNILSFASGMEIFFDRTVECVIQDIEGNGLTRLKNVDLMSFHKNVFTDRKDCQRVVRLFPKSLRRINQVFLRGRS